ncbi:MAG TPA: polysaccharide biosynthesis/export family protein [Vicinamibacterales bacterium]|nr:polysaccharide biosynthesis/export family protein [Vicinamibacterales bacterium]
MRKFVSGIVMAAVAWTSAFAEQTDYVIGAQDVLAITVYDQADLSGTFNVEADGSFTFPLIGRVVAGGLTLRALEEDLERRLADGYLKNPQVSVAVQQYRSQRIFLMGEVRSPGAYQLTGDMTIIEALARAGSVTPAAGDEVLIVRPRESRSDAGPLTPDDKDADIIRVNLRELQSGVLSHNVALRDGDTVVVLRAQAVYIFGQVRNPGAFAIEKGTTVLQALSLAGGVTDRGSTGRVFVVREVDGKKKEFKVKLSDTVEPGDTLIIKERFF